MTAAIGYIASILIVVCLLVLDRARGDLRAVRVGARPARASRDWLDYAVVAAALVALASGWLWLTRDDAAEVGAYALVLALDALMDP